MFTRLLTTATRCMSSSMRRRIATHPTRNGEKLTNSALCVFMKKNFKPGSKGPMAAFKSLRKSFAALPKNQLLKYKKVAQQNKSIIKKRLAVFKNAKMTAYVLFVKKNYAKAAKGKTFMKAVKDLCKKWKSLGKAGQAKYVAQAASIRKIAAAQRDRMIAKYNA